MFDSEGEGGGLGWESRRVRLGQQGLHRGRLG